MGTYLYCQNTSCNVYLGSLGGDSCHHCGWASGEEPECMPASEPDDIDQAEPAPKEAP